MGVILRRLFFVENALIFWRMLQLDAPTDTVTVAVNVARWKCGNGRQNTAPAIATSGRSVARSHRRHRRRLVRRIRHRDVRCHAVAAGVR